MSAQPARGRRRYRYRVDRRFLRPGWVAGHVLVVAAVLTCLRLGWWQWERTQQTTGTAQNFGYALLWPAFGAAFIYMWVRFLHMEVLKDIEDEQDTERGLRELLAGASGGATAGDGFRAPQPGSGFAADHSAAEGASPATELSADDGADDALSQRRRDRLGEYLQRPSQGVTISVATVGGDDDDDPELTAYNQALAALAEEDRRRAR